MWQRLFSPTAGWRSSLFLSCPSTLLAGFRVLRSSTPSLVNSCVHVGMQCLPVPVWMTERVKVRLRDWEGKKGNIRKIKQDPVSLIRPTGVSLTSGHLFVHIIPVSLPCVNGERSYSKPQLQFQMISTFAAMPALWLDHSMIAIGGDFGSLVLIRAARCSSR